MKKETDINGYELRYDVPLTKIGVFPYLGRQIDPELEPDKVYFVLRPKEELTAPETLKSLEEIPFIDDHTMIGKDFTPAEVKGIHGVTGSNVKVNGDLITNDLKIYSDKLKNLIDGGKRDLSMGYRCNYELTKGEYKGQPYDAIQRNIRFNHVALVDEGRMGSECRVTDNAIVYDSLDINEKEQEKMTKFTLDEDLKEELKEEIKKELLGETEPNKVVEVEKEKEEVKDEVQPGETKVEDADEDKRKLIDEIGGILNGKVDEEIFRTIMQKAEELAYNPSETGANDACGAKDENVEEKEETKKEEISMDSAIKYIAKRDNLIDAVKPIIGDNAAYKSMTIDEVVAYACDKLDIKPSLNRLEGYLAGAMKSKLVVSVAADNSYKMDKDKASAGFRDYLNGK